MLPFDQLIRKLTKDEVRKSLLNLMAAAGLPTTSWQEGSVVLTIVEVVAILIAGFTAVLVAVVRGGFRELAEGIWLTYLSKYVYGVDRIGATFATTTLTLTNSGGGVYTFDSEEAIFKNSVTKALYRNVSVFTLNAGPATTLNINVRAVAEGTGSNANPGEITEIVTTMLGVTCTNATAALATDEESDVALRQRDLDALGALSPNGAAAAYAYFAKSTKRADGSTIEVNRVSVSPDSSTGEVTVIVASSSGGVTGTVGDTSTDLGLIDENIQTSCVPLGITCTVASAVTTAIAVTANVYISAAAAMTTGEVQDAVEARLAEYFANSVPIGGHVISPATGRVYRNALIGQIEDVSSFIIKADVTTPSGDTTLATNAVPVLGVTTINVTLVS